MIKYSYVKNIKTEQPGTQSPQEAQYIKGSLEWRKPLANYKGGEGQGSITQFPQWPTGYSYSRLRWWSNIYRNCTSTNTWTVAQDGKRPMLKRHHFHLWYWKLNSSLMMTIDILISLSMALAAATSESAIAADKQI